MVPIIPIGGNLGDGAELQPIRIDNANFDNQCGYLLGDAMRQQNPPEPRLCDTI